jgi:hypothetical protein
VRIITDVAEGKCISHKLLRKKCTIVLCLFKSFFITGPSKADGLANVFISLEHCGATAILQTVNNSSNGTPTAAGCDIQRIIAGNVNVPSSSMCFLVFIFFKLQSTTAVMAHPQPKAVTSRE